MNKRRTHNVISNRFSLPLQRLKHLLPAVLMFLLSGCIEPYDSGIDETIKVISVDGSLVKGAPLQQITLSRSTTMTKPEFNPLRGCLVTVTDELGNEFPFEESAAGTYSRVMNNNHLVYGRQYRLIFVTPEGERYESDYETLNPCAEVDSVYHELQDGYDAFTGIALKGYQFYVDIQAPDTISRYYRWILDETWEYTVTWPVTYLIPKLRAGLEQSTAPYALYRCWITLDVPSIYVSSTVNLTLNEKKKIPLNYVTNQTERLSIKYSLLVRQYALDEGAYKFFLQNRITIQEPGGLYTQQPAQPVSNICNVNDPDEKVLGYFWVASCSEKRIFVTTPRDMSIETSHCYLEEYDGIMHGRGPFPVYIQIDEKTGTWYTARQACFDCTLKGGNTIKPDFWK
ncbi:MAG: DUF4249 domain-containing protein [Bacteroidales bacterium]|nr:DUF4249 domain-containing protein [Bacteroidales bacterium]